ncbi:hypothetical protein M8818_007401 [Zalaria obscura]|uniref:Uncharacterized protein n=1 Tax=Zalaria obscura TaxID=2024903 RepID=A0ACC3S795_9PEZI
MEKDIEKGKDDAQSRPRSQTIPTTKEHSSLLKAITVVGINIVSTTAIVYVNKSVFSGPFSRCQSSFVAFHFAITGATLYLLSRPRLSFFRAQAVSPRTMLPLAAVMSANVLLMNLSLAFSTIILYQIVRVLLSPLTAAINFLLYGARTSASAFVALLLACVGVGVTSYFESKPKADASEKQTTAMGAGFAFAAVASSAVYTVWVGQYHKRLQLSSPQLLLNMTPLGTLLLGGASFFTDSFPVWGEVTRSQWGFVVLSGLLACIVNVSQFFIIDIVGPVSATVVGHSKTCTIVGLGWMTSPRPVSPGSILGVFLAIGGMVMYSWRTYTV